jgi:arabinogalactan oligomer/maltooligosaccharide transport system substrate-binding protein
MRKYSVLALAMVAIVLITAACGGAATPAPQPTAAPQAAAPTEAPKSTEAPPPTEAPAPTEVPAPTEAPQAAAAATLTLWHGWTGTEADTLGEIVKAYEAANSGTKVDLLAVPFDQLKNKFTTEASTGGGPDLLIGPKDWIGELAQAGLISPLDDLASQIGLDQLNKSAVDANKFQGQTWAFPESTEAVALWYNKDLVKTPPKDTDELLKLAAEVGLAYNSGFYHSAGLLLGGGGKIFDENGKCVLDQGNAVVDALAMLAKAKGTANVIADSDGSKLDAAFKDGKVGMIFNGPWGTGDYVKALGADKLGIADPIDLKPGPGKFSPFLGTKNLFLSANSQGDAQKAALAFLNFMSQPDTQGMLAKIGHIPSNPAVKIDDPIQNGFLKQTQVSSYFPNEPEMGAVWTPAADMITAVIEGKTTPAEAAKLACATINAANKK